MKEQIILAGFGGQGIMMAGMLLTYGGMVEGQEVCWLPSYGPEMRGGTANCHVTISDRSISSPIITNATSAVVMNRPSLEKFESILIENAVLLINSSLVEIMPERTDIRAFYIPANEIAVEAGSIKAVNVVMLGAFVEAANVIKKRSAEKAIEEILGGKKKALLTVNLKAFEQGCNYVKKLRYQDN